MIGRIFDRLAVLFANRGGPEPVRSAFGLALAAIAILALVLLASTAIGSVGSSSHCSTACVKRVERRDFAKAHGGCYDRACVERVAAKRWRHARWLLPDSMKATLARLRFCESRGDYRATNGSHWGAYQYAWGFKGSAGQRAGFKVRPDLASPDEQDTRTARFFPSHRGEWSCLA